MGAVLDTRRAVKLSQLGLPDGQAIDIRSELRRWLVNEASGSNKDRAKRICAAVVLGAEVKDEVARSVIEIQSYRINIEKC